MAAICRVEAGADAVVGLALPADGQDFQAGGASQAFVVGGDHGAGAALAGLLHQQAHHPFGVQRVERRGRLVGQQQARRMRQGAGDGDPLALADRQRRRFLVQLVADFQPLGQRLHALGGRGAEQRAGQADVAPHIEELEQPAALQHVAAVLPAQRRQAVLAAVAPERGDVLRAFPGEEFEAPARVRRQGQRQQVEQGALAAAAGADDGQLATRAQFQRRHPQAVALATGAVAAGDLVQAQDHGSVDSGTRYSASPASASPNRTQLATSLWKVS